MKTANKLMATVITDIKIRPVDTKEPELLPKVEVSEDMAWAIEHTFELFKAHWGRKFTSRFKTQADIDMTKQYWLGQLTRENVPVERISWAVESVLASSMDWPPEYPDFRRILDNWHLRDVPSKQVIYQEIVDWHGKYRNGKKPPWSHDIAGVINDRIGHHILAESERQFKLRMERVWDEILAGLKAGHTLAPRDDAQKALPEPPAPPMPELGNSPLMQSLKNWMKSGGKDID
jgi:hypothetical protein